MRNIVCKRPFVLIHAYEMSVRTQKLKNTQSLNGTYTTDEII